MAVIEATSTNNGEDGRSTDLYVDDGIANDSYVRGSTTTSSAAPEVSYTSKLPRNVVPCDSHRAAQSALTLKVAECLKSRMDPGYE